MLYFSLKSAIGRVFFDYYGENLFRSDMGIERGALGSLLGHSGPVGESERNIARIFGADRSYSVLNGTSASNRAIMSACVGDDEMARTPRGIRSKCACASSIASDGSTAPENTSTLFAAL